MNNIFQNKSLMVLKKKRHSEYYENIIKNISRYGKPSNIFFIDYDSNTNVYNLNKKLYDELSSNKIDIFISLSYYFISPEILKKTYNKITLIRFEGDDMTIFNHYSRWYAQFFDINITTNISTHYKFKELNYNSICHAFPCPPTKKKENILTPKYDISFIGQSLSSIRSEYIDKIKKSKLDVQIFGVGSKNGYISEENKFEIYKNSKINISFSSLFYFHNGILEIEPDLKLKKQTLGRIFEIISVGGFVLTENSPSLSFFFKPGEHLDTFDNEDEMIRKIHYYLLNDIEREKIAKNALDFFNANYENESYFKDLINKISNIKIVKRDLSAYIWPKYVKNFNTQFIKFRFLFNINYFLFIYKFTNLYFYVKTKFLSLVKM